MKKVVLECDDLDYDAIQAAITHLQKQRNDSGCYALPDGEGNQAGRCIAEVCRGYLDMLGCWKY